MPRTSFLDADAWEAFWMPALHGAERMDGLDRAAAALREALVPEGFRLFRNGGTPLLERRLGNYVQELVLIPGPLVDGHPSVNIRVHVSLPELKLFRERYWRPSSMAPALVAGGDVGLLDLPPVYGVWRASADPSDGEDLAIWLCQTVLPWLDGFEDTARLALQFGQGGYPMIGLATSLELVALNFGKFEARRFLHEVLEANPSIAPREKERIRLMTLSTGIVRGGGMNPFAGLPALSD
jgi:hypothetical protein